MPTGQKGRKLNREQLFACIQYCPKSMHALVTKQLKIVVYFSGITWDEIHEFVQEAKLDLIFDLNVLKRTKDQKWNSTNAIELLKYTQGRGYTMAGWELGNGRKIIHVINKKIIYKTVHSDIYAAHLNTFYKNTHTCTSVRSI